MWTRIKVYLVAALLSSALFWLVAQIIIQLLNAVFGFHYLSHYRVTRII